MTNKRETAEIFRERLLILIERRNETVSAFAQRCGIDRSALSQFLDSNSIRLPRAETLTSIAKSENISIDWILGVSQDDEVVGEVISLMDVEAGFSGAEDSPMARWHRDAVGYKIRYSPTTLPDLLRTKRVIEYEFENSLSTYADIKHGHSLHQLNYSRSPNTDVESVVRRQTLENLANGTDIWSGLSPTARKEQLDYMIYRNYPAWVSA